MNVILRCGIVLAAVTGAAACDASTSTGVRSGWLAQGRITRSILSGTTSAVQEGSILAWSGQTIEVSYDVTAREGSLRLSVWRPLTPHSAPKLLEGLTIASTQRGTLSIRVDEFLRYDIRLQPVHFGGKYDIRWSLR